MSNPVIAHYKPNTEAIVLFKLIFLPFCSESDIEYFNGDKELPILSRHNQVRTSSLSAVTAILNTPKEFVCSKHPTQININCAFVVDTSKLKDSGDLKCDDCGAWKQTKTATTYLAVCVGRDGSVSSVHRCSLSKSSTRKRYYTLIRRHYICKSSNDLSRHISILLDPTGKQNPFQLIQYRFSGVEHSVAVKPHGNSKKSLRPYKRTCPSTIKDLKEEVKEHDPK